MNHLSSRPTLRTSKNLSQIQPPILLSLLHSADILEIHAKENFSGYVMVWDRLSILSRYGFDLPL